MLLSMFLLSPAPRGALISRKGDSQLMECQYTSCRLSCHRCGHTWTYMGTRLSGLRPEARPVKVQCPRCKVQVAMDVRNAR